MKLMINFYANIFKVSIQFANLVFKAYSWYHYNMVSFVYYNYPVSLSFIFLQKTISLNEDLYWFFIPVKRYQVIAGTYSPFLLSVCVVLIFCNLFYSECVALQDPYCAWDKTKGACSSSRTRYAAIVINHLVYIYKKLLEHVLLKFFIAQILSSIS